jgi:AraC family transcriptional regulator, regulatory protein of adaptative response / methylated-DNA-[protein]-cysteine methyltransferase
MNALQDTVSTATAGDETRRGSLHLREANTEFTGTIRYATGASTLGKILVASSDLGVCAVWLGDDERSLETELSRAHPKARLDARPAALKELLAHVTALVETPVRGFDQVLDVAGTRFQQSVWLALRTIPAGSTASYADIAARIGRPDAVRAVGSACAANVLAIAIPCHRVIKSDRTLSGYRWGTERKRALLQRERRA